MRNLVFAEDTLKQKEYERKTIWYEILFLETYFITAFSNTIATSHKTRGKFHQHFTSKDPDSAKNTIKLSVFLVLWDLSM